MDIFNLSGKAIIAGVGETAMGKHPGKSSLALHALASKLALADAGLSKSDIDGVLTCGSLVDNWPHHSGAFCEYFDIQPKYTDTVTQGGGWKLHDGSICRYVDSEWGLSSRFDGGSG